MKLCLLIFSSLLAAAEPGFPGREWPAADPAELGLATPELEKARDYALSAGGSGRVIYRGKLVLHWGDQKKLYDIKSATKSFGAIALGLAIDDRKIELDSPAVTYLPSFGIPPESNQKKGWLPKITILQLATHTAGFEKPGGFGKLLAEPATAWIYSDSGPNWLADCITTIYRRDLQELMFERVFTPIGISREDLRWRNNSYRPRELDGIPRREFGAGIHANIDALARIGYLHLREGNWTERQILSREYIQRATRAAPECSRLPERDPEHSNASEHYGLLWWNNADQALANVPADAYWAWGLFDSLIVVIPSLDLVIVRGGENGRSWPRKKGANHYDVLKGFLEPVAASIPAAPQGAAPYRPSDLIESIRWSPTDTIIRKARGSDNWPMTWADDDALYTAYGDGNGFEPFLEKKLSLGFARIDGGPDNFVATNIRSDGERLGDGAKGPKASGMLMVDGIVYLLVRNVTNSQLGWSTDRAKKWSWADWKFSKSFGCPTFLNFGRNYEGARDEFVYIYSNDSRSAYEVSDHMVLARVSKNQIKSRSAYRFFSGLNQKGEPIWTANIDHRRPIFTHPGHCYRSGITFNSALRRYFWVQIFAHSRDPGGPRFQGGFGIYEAPEPWGPWRTVFFAPNWDVGPGESASFPTKWMSKDGFTMHLVFSGDDHFSVRKGSLQMKESSGASD